MSDYEFFKTYQFNDKKRLGNKGDGGYVIADIGDYDCYISAGISDEESFSRDFIQQYHTKNNFGFDGTITTYPYEYTKEVEFIRKNIGSMNTDTTTNLHDLMSTYKSIFLKMDIEGGEYPWIDAMSLDHLNNIKQLVIEFHGVNDDTWGTSLSDKIRCFNKLATTHYIVHAHGNNCSGIQYIPEVLELTYVNKEYFVVPPPLNRTPFPILHLDYPNWSSRPAYRLHYEPFMYPISHHSFYMYSDILNRSSH
jgi:hypothetical protein